MNQTRRAWGVGVATVSASDVILDVYFRKLGWGDETPQEH